MTGKVRPAQRRRASRSTAITAATSTTITTNTQIHSGPGMVRLPPNTALAERDGVTASVRWLCWPLGSPAGRWCRQGEPPARDSAVPATVGDGEGTRLRPAPPFAQSDPFLAATQGDMALHRSIDGEDSGQPEAEMAAGRNATGRRPRLAWPRRCDRASRRDEMSFRKRRAHPRPTRRLASCCRGWSGASTPGRLGLAPTPPWASCCPGSPAASGAVDRQQSSATPG
jgi:hypothetical protein